jgi:putative Mg2+ transporter-C (MgtC) family protein
MSLLLQEPPGDGLLAVPDILLRLIAAVLLGGVLGFEREWRAKPAGLRTHMMVALGSACFTLAALALAQETVRGMNFDVRTMTDPTRVVEGVIGGIGFLGAGAIIRHKDGVQGLTTAGSIWLVGAVGVATGAGHYGLAVLAVLLATIILSVIGGIEHRFTKNRPQRDANGPPEDPGRL